VIGNGYSGEDIAMQCVKFGANSCTVCYQDVMGPMGHDFEDLPIYDRQVRGLPTRARAQRPSTRAHEQRPPPPPVHGRGSRRLLPTHFPLPFHSLPAAPPTDRCPSPQLPTHFDGATKEFVFPDGSRGKFDGLIYCTGYKVRVCRPPPAPSNAPRPPHTNNGLVIDRPPSPCSTPSRSWRRAA
jgi:hypothetical protein